nr:Toll/interleukin-1 receptor (TIR) domain-containing protein [Tanacetum cinerariifolium]
MDRLRDLPESKIVDKLKISYDGLKPVEKELFLDIACFFRGERKRDTMEIFDACGFHPEIGIKVLIQKSLITMGSNGRFGMHDLIQEMGHYIVRGEHPHNPEKHSRVWKPAEVSNMCFGDGTVENDHIEAIEFGHDIHWPQFIMLISKMKKLRWLRLERDNEGNVVDTLSTHLPDEEYISERQQRETCSGDAEMVEAFSGFASEIQRIEKKIEKPNRDISLKNRCGARALLYEVLAPSFEPGVTCRGETECNSGLNDIHRMASACITRARVSLLSFANIFLIRMFIDLWEYTSYLQSHYPHLPPLKVLQLLHLERLVSTPDFNGLLNLQKLELNECYELKEIHPSHGNHRSLKYVDVSYCSKLRMFPTIVRMEQLESLYISHYDESLVFPEIQSNMKCLVKLDLHHIQIDALLSSIGERCTNLIYLRWFYCFNLNSTQVRFDGLKCLEEFICSTREKTPFPLPLTCSLRNLDLRSCHFEDGEIPSDISELSNLQDQDLSFNNFSKLDFSLSQLTRLKLLNLSYGKRLVKLPELPSGIAIIMADGCDKFTTIGDLTENCKWLCYISLFDSTVIDGNRLVQSMLKGNAIENQSMHIRIKGLEIPKQFTNRLYAGDKYRLPLSENWCNDFCGFLICAVLEPRFYCSTSPGITIKEEVSDDMRGMFHDVVWGKVLVVNLHGCGMFHLLH